MKLLHIADDFRDAQVAARALRGISPNVTVLWASSTDRAAFWIRNSPDLAALIVDVQCDSQGRVYLEYVRSLGLKAPVVVVLPQGASLPLESLKAGADDYVTKNDSLAHELPDVVIRTIERVQTLSTGPWDHLRSGTLVESDAQEPAERQANKDVSHARERADEQLRDRSLEAERARQGDASAAEVERLARREAELASMLADAEATRNSLERQLADIDSAFRDANERATQDRLAAAERVAEREAEIDGLLRQERAARAHVEQTLAHVQAVLRDAEVQHASALARAATALADRHAQFETELSQAVATCDDLRRQLRDVAAALEHARHLDADHREERDGLERGRVVAEAEVRRLAASVSERDARLDEQAGRHSASLQAVEHDRAQLQDEFQMTMAARDREIEQLQGTVKATIQELVSAKTRCEALQSEVPELRRQLDESRAEVRRQFHRAPLPLCRCTRDGALAQANRAFAALIGCRKPDELRGADFANAVFESPGDLSWLIERCLSTRATQSVETVWKRVGGERIAVRLSALESTTDLIEIAAEDITNLRALQDRLGQAHRMEAVGRLASEIAVTCSNLLRDVHHDAQQWLTTVSDNAALRQRGEGLLDEVTRAASFLQQLAAYGDEQSSALEPVDLNRVLRDLKPVLKEVAGDDIELELPKISSPLNVDVKAERVERLLVNVASYGRERMPFGGRLTIELATVVVDQKFIAQYPNVRQGPHALITVTEVSRARRAEGSRPRRSRGADPSARGVASERPGVDLGALQELIGECAGHLWMTVEPPGDMVVKIHLPLRAWDDQAQTHPPDARTRWRPAQWFRR